MNEGNWIKINRKITEWEWYDDPVTFKVFFHLLLTASCQDKNLFGVELKRGEVLQSITSIASQNGLTVKNVYTAIDHLINTKSITVRRVRKYSIFKVCEYEKYVDEGKHE